MQNIDVDKVELYGIIFMVNEKPYTLWMYGDFKEKSIEFVDSIDDTYFEKIAQVYNQSFQDNDFKDASALALRLAYSHGLETLFTYLCATIQAPLAPQAWVSLISNKELREIVKKISTYKNVPTVIEDTPLCWQFVANFILRGLSLENESHELQIKTEFAKLWGKWAHEFVDEAFQREYNAIKHGLRIKQGGFSMSFGREIIPGKRPDPKDMQVLGTGKFGASFLETYSVENSQNNLFLKLTSRNWDPDDMTYGLLLISMSIKNILSCLRILNGFDGTKVIFSYPTEISAFEECFWRSRKLGVTAMRGWGLNVTDKLIASFTPKEMSEFYKNKKYIHKRVFNKPKP